jgi:hypothetical protein
VIKANQHGSVIGTVWMYTYEICNIITDASLMAVSFHLVLSVKIQIMQKLRILSLFGVGIFLISISVIRIIQGRDSRTQSGHTLWASIEVLFAVIVAVTPTIYALGRNKYESSTYVYETNHTATRIAERNTHSAESDKYSTGIWTELEDGISREDNPSQSRILVHEEWHVETSKSGAVQEEWHVENLKPKI